MVTVFTALAAVALLLVLGLVVDGSGRLRAASRADRVAAEAARAGVEAVDTRGHTLVLDRPAAIAAATAYLHAAGASGTVTVTGPRTVRVTVTITGHTLILGLTGHPDYQLSRTATATLTTGVTAPDNP
jgi:Flp pilus assembly protein TadG